LTINKDRLKIFSFITYLCQKKSIEELIDFDVDENTVEMEM